MSQVLTMLLTIAIDTYAALVRQPAAQAVAWALLQFVWQGAAIGAVTALALFALRRGAADVRYVLASIGMALMLTLPVVTAVQKYSSLRATTAPVSDPDFFSQARFSRGSKNQDLTPVSSLGESARAPNVANVARARALAPALMFVWLAGVTLLTLRLITGWFWMQRMRTHGVRPVEPALERLVAQLSRRLHIPRTVALLESAQVDVPAVIGWLKPLVLLPASAIAALSPAQLEAILAHELAHIRRHDYLVNLLQTLVETLLFYHPAVWWVSRRIRIERENCCDDLAVRLCGDPVAYAKALADLESLRSPMPPFGSLDRLAVAATGGSLLQRVRRLVGAPASHSGVRPAWLAAGAALLVVGGMTVGADGVPPAHVTAALATIPAIHTHLAPLVRAQEDVMTAAAAHAKPIARVLHTVPVALTSAVQSTSHSSSDSHGNWSWSNGSERLQADYTGTFDFTDDDTDVRQMSPGARLRISDGQWQGTIGQMFSTPAHLVEITERNGQIEHHYFVNGAERAYDPEGRAWLRQNLPTFVRNAGINAPARVGRLLKSGGAPAVLAEIGRVDGNYVRGIYYRELFKQATLTPEQYRQVLSQASTEMKGSNYELSQLLIALVDRLPNDEATRAAYFDAASTLTGAYETGRVYSAMLKKGTANPQTVSGILDHLKTLNSDYEVSQLLLQVIAQQPLDARNSAALLDVTARMHGDYERSRVLSEFLTRNSIEGGLQAPFFRAVDAVHGSYERGRILDLVAARPDASHDTLKNVIDATRTMAPYETSQLLLKVAGSQSLTGDLRDAYIAAAERLGEYEQGRVMTALVKSEKRK